MYSFVGEIARTVDRISAVGRIFYTRRQLYYEFCRTVRRRFVPWPSRLTGLTPRPLVSVERFDSALARYVALHGAPDGLLEPPLPITLSVDSREPDLGDYGLRQLLICEDGRIAAMLVANGLHRVLCCAVLPLQSCAPLPDLLCAMLARADRSHVYFLHDADPGSLSLVRTLPRRLELPRGIPFSSIGLMPAHAMRMRLFATRSRSTWALHAASWHEFSEQEEVWLRAGWRAEVAAVPPVDLLRMVRNTTAPSMGGP